VTSLPAASSLSHSKPRSAGFLANVATVLGGQAASIVVALLSQILFARLLGPGPRGQVSICMMAVALGALMGNLGADIPIVVWSTDAKKKPAAWLSAICLWALLGCGVAGSAWWIAYGHLQRTALQGVTPTLAIVVLATIPIAVLFSDLIAFLTGAERFGERAGTVLVQAGATLVAFGGLTFFVGRTANAALLGNILGLLCGVVVAGWLLRGSFAERWAAPALTKQVRDGLMAGLRGQIGNVAAFFNYRLDVFIVNYFLGVEQVGLYSVGVVVSEGLWQIPQAVATALFPRTARTSKEDSAEFTCLIMRQVFAISCVTGLVLALLSPIVIPLLFGDRFRPSVPVIWWILPGTIALSLAKIASSDLAGRYKTGYSSAFGVVAFCTTVGLDFLLIPRMGILGAALASSAAYLVHGTLLMLALKHEFRVGWKTLLVPRREELSHYSKAWKMVTAA